MGRDVKVMFVVCFLFGGSMLYKGPERDRRSLQEMDYRLSGVETLKGFMRA